MSDPDSFPQNSYQTFEQAIEQACLNFQAEFLSARSTSPQAQRLSKYSKFNTGFDFFTKATEQCIVRPTSEKVESYNQSIAVVDGPSSDGGIVGLGVAVV